MTPKQLQRRYPKALIEKAFKMALEGVPRKVIADELGMSESTVYLHTSGKKIQRFRDQLRMGESGGARVLNRITATLETLVEEIDAMGKVESESFEYKRLYFFAQQAKKVIARSNEYLDEYRAQFSKAPLRDRQIGEVMEVLGDDTIKVKIGGPHD